MRWVFPWLWLAIGVGGCATPPWEMPCPEGWVMDADQQCYDPAADDDDSADDEDGESRRLDPPPESVKTA